jgi:hypothetical protein
LNRGSTSEHQSLSLASLYCVEGTCHLEAERFLIESNRQRAKAKVQRLREYKKPKEIEAKLAAERQKEQLRRGKESPVPKNFSERGESGTRAAKMVGLSRPTAEKGLAVLNRAEAGDEKAMHAIEALERGKILRFLKCQLRLSPAALGFRGR